jgi:exodeoxyribonuclease V beta subunit
VNHLDAYAAPLAGLHLIEASAGTGKTHAITTLYLRAVVEAGLLPEQILVVTFTRAATDELRERIRSRLRVAEIYFEHPESQTDPSLCAYLARQANKELCLGRLRSALLVIDQAAVTTIHGFCARVLEQNAFENHMPFGTELVESVTALVDEIVNDFIISHLSGLSEIRIRALRSIGIGAQQLRSLADVVMRRDDYYFEPVSPDIEDSVEEALSVFEEQRKRALAWLSEADNVGHLTRLNKTKPRGTLGKRLAGYVQKIHTWLTEPFFRLDEPCSAIERVMELAEKNPAAQTGDLLEWFSQLRLATDAFERLQKSILQDGVRLRFEFLAYLREELEQRKLVRRIQTYDDLLRRLRATLVGSGGDTLAALLRARFPVGMIDEFQDTDPVQFEVFSRIYAREATLFLIGDPKQSIYAFRGADVDSYLQAKRDPRITGHTLHVNWRSDPSLLSGLQHLYGLHPDPFLGAGIDFVSVEARPGAVDLRDAAGAPVSGILLLPAAGEAGDDDAKAMPKYRARSLATKAAVSHVRGLLSLRLGSRERRVEASDIAVLCRTNRECQVMADALRSSGIRCVQTSDFSVLFSDACSSILTLLRALVLPNDSRRLTALLGDELVGYWPHDIEQVRDATDEWDGWVERLLNFRRLWERSGVLAVLVRWCDEVEVKPRVLGQASGERYITDLLHVAEIVDTMAKQQRLTPQGQLDWLLRARSGEHDSCIEDQQLRIEADSKAVLVTTVHRSKGLQFPFVVCPFLWDGGARRAGGTLEYGRQDKNGAASVRIVHLEPRLLGENAPERGYVEAERLRENARLLYVALTRAKHQVALVWARATGSDSSALAHLLLGGAGGSADTQSGDDTAQQSACAKLTALADGEAIRLGGTGSLAPLPDERTGASESSLAAPDAWRRVITASVKTTSYSALTASASGHGDEQRDLGRDVDALLVGAPVVEGHSEDQSAASAPSGVELHLLDLPAGTRTGEALHEILERMDFEDYMRDGSDLDVSGILGRFGLDAGRFEPKVRAGMRAVLEVPLKPSCAGLRLANIARAGRKSELEFLMKVHALSANGLKRTLSPEVTGLDGEYGDELSRLNFDPVSGYLRGFIDLVFEFDGRYYVVDYKSSVLGNTIDCYSRAHLDMAMRAHHYPIQATIYAAAVDRWLRVAHAEYDYERHFGGVFYLFLRGMAPQLGADSGVFFCRPSQAGLSQFETMLEGSAA